MCGRYYFDPQIDLTDLKRKLSTHYTQDQLCELKTGEVFPGDIVLTITEFGPALMNWGYNLFTKKIINTRIESIKELNYYDQDYRHNKCLIAVSGFYEWSNDKQCYYMTLKNTPFYLAGIYQNNQPFNHFSIITTRAEQTYNIHQRIPLVFSRMEAAAYLNNQYTIEQLSQIKPELIVKKIPKTSL
ncbi:MAG: SOS response-associated peptidase family protein [Erysipelotrichia bacterium]|nr:SOS response-associated peptidase family protein [Erysipelotrichia bacterium]